jgi:hypothetical protein
METLDLFGEVSPPTEDEIIQGVLRKSIKDIKQWFRENKRKPNKTFLNKMIHQEISPGGRNRVTLLPWLAALKDKKIKVDDDGIGQLLYYERVSCLKSCLQKFIRRSDVTNALKTAKRLYFLGHNSAQLRTPLIIAEDVPDALEVLPMLKTDYLTAVKIIASTPKNKSKVNDILALIEQKKFKPFPTFNKDMILNENVPIQNFLSHLLPVNQKANIIRELFQDYDEIVKLTIARALKGTYFTGDTISLLIIAIQYLRNKLNHVNFNEVSPVDWKSVKALKDEEMSWYALDNHTPIGKKAFTLFLKNHPEISRFAFDYAWFCESSALLEPQEEWKRWKKQFYNVYQPEMWQKHKNEIKKLIYKVAKDKYSLNLENYPFFITQ